MTIPNPSVVVPRSENSESASDPCTGSQVSAISTISSDDHSSLRGTDDLASFAFLDSTNLRIMAVLAVREKGRSMPWQGDFINGFSIRR